MNKNTSETQVIGEKYIQIDILQFDYQDVTITLE
jgi:hypothetical protein